MNLIEKIGLFLKEIISKELKKNVNELSSNTPFEKFGIDSLMIMRLNKILEDQFGRLPRTLFYEYKNIQDLAIYFSDKHSMVLEKILQSKDIEQHYQYKEKYPEDYLIRKEEDTFRNKVELFFINILAEETKKSTNEIQANTPFEKLRLDSLLIMRINKRLESSFGNLPKTLFYEYKNIHRLAQYFIEKHFDRLNNFVLPDKNPRIIESNNQISVNYRKIGNILNPSLKKQIREETNHKKSIQDIAVIGISGIYPQADNLDELWKNLINRKDCIIEIPEDRWPYSKLDSTLRSRWGGFISDVDKFDPLFFNITPREADLMDPQQRLFLETCWKAIEDAGYSLRLFLQKTKENVGVFVGSSWTEYEIIANNFSKESPDVHIGSIATRVSYHLGFHGPSLAIDTHCSSALTSIYLACESIRNGDCNAALAGGVNLSLHLNKYKQMNPFLSNEGKCRSFGDGGNGYVPSEGVGAIVLKPLSSAINDRDQIYGVIKSGAINHGGRSNGYTAPNPNAQSNVIKLAFSRADIVPKSISYVEAHGTGTELGDPIEIAALTKAYETNEGNKQYCSIGSLKSNIGHCEAAAGIAQVTKVLLQMKHKILVPSIYSSKINTNITFEDTPFYIQNQLTEWKRPEVYENGKKIIYPRRAGISSFGAGGSNAHLIIEEFEREKVYISNEETEYLIPLSARNKSSLDVYILNIINWLKAQETGTVNLASIAYTLQMGREAMDERIIVLVSNIHELIDQLTNYLNGNINKVHYGKKEKNDINALMNLEEGYSFLKNLVEKKRFDEISKLWVIGVEINWDLFYTNFPVRISLPTYPFERMRCWIQENKDLIQTNNEVRKLVLKKSWKESIPNKNNEKVSQYNFIILSNIETFQLAKTINEKISNNQGIIIIDKSDLDTKANPDIRFSFQSALEGQQIANQIINKFEQIQGVIDLSDIYITSKKTHTGIEGRISLLQELIKNMGTSRFYLFHLTSGLQTYKCPKPTLSGAEFKGFIKMLGYEYRMIDSKTIDIDIPLILKDDIIDLLKTEICHHDPEVCYRKGKRYIPCLKEAEQNQNNELQVNPSYVYVITGGTSGIGAEIAQHLVKKGVRKLVLMGINEIPERKEWDEILKLNDPKNKTYEKIANLISLEQKGISVELYIGSLTNKKEMDSFFERIRKQHGKLGGIIHCAGVLLTSNLMFINKQPDEIKKTFEPKVEALKILHEIFEEDKLDFFILFSSISSIIPWLATGGSDYAAANDFMNAFAEYQISQGNSYYKSVIWPSWKGVGMGEVTSPIYINMGFKSHTLNEGISLFEKIFEFVDECLLLPCVVQTDIFNENELLIPEKWLKSIYAPKDETNSNNKRISSQDTINWLRQFFSSELRIPIDQLQNDILFHDYGVDSIRIAELVQKMEENFHIQLNPSIILEYPTLKSLASYIEETSIYHSLNKIDKTNENIEKDTNEKHIPDGKKHEIGRDNYLKRKIAIIGMACNFPNSPDIDTFWYNLANGVDCIEEIPKSRFDISSYYYPEYKCNCSISKHGGFINNIEDFDAKYFKINEDDAPHIDPLMRQFMESSIQAIRNAGYEEQELSGKKVGVYAGTRVSNFGNKIQQMRKNTSMGIGQNFIASHISHLLNLKGPSMVVDTACSSSLTSLHIASQSLLLEESEMALAGGVDIIIDEKAYILLSEARALSPDGKCHTFDEKANGFVLGEGCGVVILKLLEKAIDDGDRILAVIDGSALNNDGYTMGITTPNPEAQRNVIEEAIKNAQISPTSISYIEAHGTGTLIGDPIELKAINQVFRRYTNEKQFCSIGSVKTNHGHLLSAAGISGLIKVVLSIINKQIPPTLNCSTPNSRFDFENSPFFINSNLTSWKKKEGIRRAGISAFGFGGTNTHFIISECPKELLEKRYSVKNPLPPIQFNKKRYWIENEISEIKPEIGNTKSPLLEIIFETPM